MNKLPFIQISMILIIISFLTISFGMSLTLANGQPVPANRTMTATTSKTGPIPVLLIHGYASDASVWKKWEPLLNKDHIPYIEVNFGSFLGPFYGPYYDECGTAVDHANDLRAIIQNTIQDMKKITGQNQVNIVAHSKGGLDARVYLANSETHDIANLIMIGTPNAGSPLAKSNNLCWPAVGDIRPGADDTKVAENNNTKYYTIYGDWNPSVASSCPQVPNLLGIDWLQIEKDGFSKLQKPNDGLVPSSSVESLPYHTNLGHTANCHTNLLSENEYALSRHVLLER
jgi:pimeloyl-ACP methyl ester carboxylesterase